jgi:RNA polymerase sigma-70 factor (ECF subfamily)
MPQFSDNGIFLTRWKLCVPVWRLFNGVNEPGLDNDVDLLREISAGDRSAFARFYDQYSKLLFSIAFKILNDAKESEDVLQEVFLQVWDKAAHYDPRLGKPVSWAVTLTRNKAIDHIRSSQRRSRLMEQAATEMTVLTGGAGTANESVRGRESADLISSAVADLPADQRKAIEMAFFSGLTQNEISETLKEPLGTIKARIRRGMLKLRDRLEGCV